jgi:hypothetical protein
MIGIFSKVSTVFLLRSKTFAGINGCKSLRWTTNNSARIRPTRRIEATLTISRTDGNVGTLTSAQTGYLSC